jgi:hypothetical protein
MLNAGNPMAKVGKSALESSDDGMAKGLDSSGIERR